MKVCKKPTNSFSRLTPLNLSYIACWLSLFSTSIYRTAPSYQENFLKYQNSCLVSRFQQAPLEPDGSCHKLFLVWIYWTPSQQIKTSARQGFSGQEFFRFITVNAHPPLTYLFDLGTISFMPWFLEPVIRVSSDGTKFLHFGCLIWIRYRDAHILLRFKLSLLQTKKIGCRNLLAHICYLLASWTIQIALKFITN
jgi:hypothetical protein